MAWQIPNYQVPIQPENPHGLSVSVIGIPNAGKSSLMNQLLKSKVGVVARKSLDIACVGFVLSLQWWNFEPRLGV